MVLLRFMAFPAEGGAPRSPAPAPAAPAVRPAGPPVSASPVAANVPMAAPVAEPQPVAAPVSAPVAAPAQPPAPAAAPLRRPDPAPRSASPASEPPPWDEPMLGDEDLGEAVDVLDALPVNRGRDRDRDAPRAAVPRPVPAAASDRFEEPADFDRVEPPAAAAPIRMPAVPPSTLPVFERTALGDRWAELVRGWSDAGQVMALVRELAVQAELIACEEAAEPPLWRLRVGRETLRNPALVDKLTAVLRTHAGPAAVLEVLAGDAVDCVARRDAAEAERRQREAVAVIQADPVVAQLMAQFPSARILPGSIKPAA
jgi:DNA polymerase-3 subunit gamma/tau